MILILLFFLLPTSSPPTLALINCNGQDLSRRKSKGKGRIMVVLPAQLAFQKGTEGQIGILEKTDTDKPELVVDTIEVNGWL